MMWARRRIGTVGVWVAKRVLDTSWWTPVDLAYSAWLRAARENAGGSVGLVRRMAKYLRQTGSLQEVPERWASDLSTNEGADWANRTIASWETGSGGKRQPRHPAEPLVREALVQTVDALAPAPPREMAWATFRDVLEAFVKDRIERQNRGGATEQDYAARVRAVRERNAQRHQFLATWPSTSSLIDPLTLGLGSWAFDGQLPPYVPRTIDTCLALRLQTTGITTISGPPKSGKSRSVLETLQRRYPEAVTWWVNPSPTGLPLVVAAAKKAPDPEKPEFVVLDDAGLIGTDPAGGLTAQRLHDLAAACSHLVVVVHDETLAGWEHQLSHRTQDSRDARSLGVTRELMDLLEHRIRYGSVLDDDETVPAVAAYEGADPRVNGFDLTRLAETFAGVQTLLANARKMLETPISVEAALLEAAIDASIALPAGTTPDIFEALAKTHYRRRQPNRPCRPQLFEAAFDNLTTGITAGSPHAILTTTDHIAYRLMDALAPELQHPDRDVMDTLKTSKLSENFCGKAALNTGGWHLRNNQIDSGRRAFTEAANRGNNLAMFNLGLLAHETGEAETARRWWECAAEAGRAEAMFNLGAIAHETGEAETARRWWERAAEAGYTSAMVYLANLSVKEGDEERARAWWERAAEAGDSTAMFMLGRLTEEEGAIEVARTWLERAAANGDGTAMVRLGALAGKEGDMETAGVWWERAANSNNPNAEAMFWLGTLSHEQGDQTAARSWWKRGAEAGDAKAMNSLGSLANKSGDRKAARTWWERGADGGDGKAMFNLGNLAHKAGDQETARRWWARAAGAGDTNAMNNLGVLADRAEDPETARDWWERAANNENPNAEAMLFLGKLDYKAGNLESARTWWERAAEAGETTAMLILGHLLDRGGNDAARLWWERAAGGGNVEAMEALAGLAEDQDNDIEAEQWRARAAEMRGNSGNDLRRRGAL